MRQTHLRWIVALLVTLVPSVAAAELVTLRGGRVLSVSAVRFEQETAVVVLRTGGEMRLPRDFVVDVSPDEVPYVAPVSVAIRVVAVGEPTAPAKGDLAALIDRLAEHHGVDTQLAHAVVRVESNYDSRAVSPKGAMGLMQLMPATARQYAVDDPFDPAQNLAAGLQHLRLLLDRFGKGKVSLALAAYNAGEGAVSRYRGIPPFRETQEYVRRILTLAGR